MGLIENVQAYYVKRSLEWSDTVMKARAKVNAGTYKVDDFFQDNVKLWLNAYDEWGGLFPFLGVDPAPVLFAKMNDSNDFDDFVTVAPLPFGVVLKGTKIVALSGSGEVAEGDVTAAAQLDGTIKVHITNAKSLVRPGVFHGVIYYNDTAGNPHLVANLLLHKL